MIRIPRVPLVRLRHVPKGATLEVVNGAGETVFFRMVKEGRVVVRRVAGRVAVESSAPIVPDNELYRGLNPKYRKAKGDG